MAPRFGTDGIRGVAGTDLTTGIVRALGAAAVVALGAEVPFLIARDTSRVPVATRTPSVSSPRPGSPGPAPTPAPPAP